MKLGKSRYYFQIGLLATVLVFLGSLTWLKAEAQSGSLAVRGYAWSDNIGWIHFDHGKSNPVMFNPADGALSGYAWSDNIGWISLERSDTGNPPNDSGSGAIARVDQTGKVLGWARAISAVSRTDGWDGWIRFDHGKNEEVSVDATSGRADGYAWGSDVVGWIDMSPGGSEPQGCEVDGTCPDNPDCDPAIRVCGPGNGGGLSVACSMPETGTAGIATAWQADAGGGNSPYTNYDWEFFNNDDQPLADTDYNILSTNADGSIANVSFTVPGSYKGKVTVTDSASGTAQSNFCSDGNDNEIIIDPPTNSGGLFEVDTNYCVGYEDDDYGCVLEIDRDVYPNKVVSNFVKLTNLTEESLTWSLNPIQVLGGKIILKFCTDASLNYCQTSPFSGAPGANIYVVAQRQSDVTGKHEYDVEIRATSTSGEMDEDLILLYYLETNVNQKGL